MSLHNLEVAQIFFVIIFGEKEELLIWHAWEEGVMIGFEVHEVSEANTAEENNEEREDK